MQVVSKRVPVLRRYFRRWGSQFRNAISQHRNYPIFLTRLLLLLLLFCTLLRYFFPVQNVTQGHLHGLSRTLVSPPVIIRLPIGTVKQGKVVLTSVGDILLGARSDTIIRTSGYSSLFKKVRTAINPHDFLMGNLEAPVTKITVPAYPGKAFVNTMREGAVKALRREGFGLLVLANNHMLDMGAKGLLDTLRAVKKYGIEPIGAGQKEGEARRGVVLSFGNGIKIGVLAYMANYGNYGRMKWYADGPNPGVAEASQTKMRNDIRRLRKYSDFIIVHLHAGECYKGVIQQQRSLARTAILEGADAVNGHHPHIAQQVELFQGKPILYSVGNFMFGTRGRFHKFKAKPFGLAVNYVVGKEGLEEVHVRGLWQDNMKTEYMPRIISGRDFDEVVAVLNEREAGFVRNGSVAKLLLK